MKTKLSAFIFSAILLSEGVSLASDLVCWDQTFSNNRARISTKPEGLEVSLGGATLGEFYLLGNGEDIALGPWQPSEFYFIAPLSSCVINASKIHCSIGSENRPAEAPLFHKQLINNLGEFQSIYSKTKLDRIVLDWAKGEKLLTVKLVRDSVSYDLKIDPCLASELDRVPDISFPQAIRDHLRKPRHRQDQIW